jgi:glyoxylase-like metal-dependent hydrolase (beta-lactamase superfamily II)
VTGEPRLSSPAVQVVPLGAGECLNLAALTERGAPWRVRRYPAGFVLLLHPALGPLLFDTGYSEQVLAAMRRWPGLLYGLVTPVRLQSGHTAAAQLAALGTAADEVRTIIVSHLHADHVGALRDFPAARFVLDPGAYPPLRPLEGLRAVRRAFLPELLPDDFEARCDPLTFAPAPIGLEPFAEAADVFGDGSVYALRVPGHAPGMTALVVRTATGADLAGDGQGLALLASDAAWSTHALRAGPGGLGAEVHPLARVAFWDAAQERQSRAQLHVWLTRHPLARVIVSHDEPEAEQAGRHAR